MFIKTFEQYNNTQDIIAYHGTRVPLPFANFNVGAIGTGFVSNGKNYGGFFFTTSMDNAEYYTEYFIAKVKINNVSESNHNPHPPTVMEEAIRDNKIYVVRDTLDGQSYSDIVVVPKDQIDNVEILEWIFVGDEEETFEKYDEMFSSDDEYDISQENINETVEMFEEDINYLLRIPIFKKYYDSKPKY